MFPITHIWFAEKVMGYIDNSVILGAVFPDIVITGCLEHKQTHYCGFSLYNYIKNNSSDFADAVATHTVNPKGLDYYGDECYKTGYKGYCFQKGSLIVNQVIDACNLPEELGLWKSHNFIEMGIELNITDCNPHLVQALRRAFEDNHTIEQVSEPVERYYGLKKNKVSDSFKGLAEHIEMEKYNCRSLAMKYDLQMKSKHNITIDIDRTAKIIENCRSIVSDDIQEFMEYSTSRVKNMLERGIIDE